MSFGRELGLLACVFLALFSLIPGVMGAGSTWLGYLYAYGTRVSSVTASVHKNFSLNGVTVGSDYLAASAPANGSAQSSATASFLGSSNASSLNYTFSWSINPSLFRAGYWEGVGGTAQGSPSGAIFLVVCSSSFILGGSGTSWESNLTVYHFSTRIQGIVNYTWASRGTQIGTVGLDAVAAPLGSTTVAKNTTLSTSPTDTSVSLTLRLNYTQPPIPTTFVGIEGNGVSNPGTLLTKLTDRGPYPPTTASSVFPPLLFSLSLVIIGIPVIHKYRRRP